MIEIEDVNQYNNEIVKLIEKWDIRNNKKLWFRGVLGEYPLLPKAYRKKIIEGSEYAYSELYIRNVFKSLYKNYHKKINGKIEEYSLMQHYGIPTRLLDFSESSLTALFFAVEECLSTKESYVYILDPGYLNSLTYGDVDGGPFISELDLVSARVDAIGFNLDESIEYYNKFPQYNSIELEYPIAFYPETESNLRIIAQKGVFVLWGTQKTSLDDLLKNKHFVCFHIVDKKSIYNELKIMGITERSIYPDMNGLSNELNSIEFLRKSF